MSYKAIIFDLDGVICTTDEYHYLAWKALADRLGIYFDREINNRLRGVSRMESLEIVLEKSLKNYTDAEKQEFATEKNVLYRELLGRMGEKDLSREVKVTLDELRARGLKLAIGSSSRNTPFILERIGLAGFFDAVSDGNNITKSKPDPEVFLKAAKMLGMLPTDCLVVEDAHAGVEAAVAGGFDCAAIGDARDDARARWHLATFSDIMEAVSFDTKGAVTMNSIYNRVSIRKYQSKPVEREKTEALLRAAMQAPSAGNQQPWEFYVVTDPARIEALSRTSPYAGCAKGAPAVIVSAYRRGCAMPEFAEIDLSIAMENLWLECDAQGLGGVWLAVAPIEARMKAVEAILDLPERLRAFALFPYGYPAERRAQQDRFDPERIHWVEA